MRLSLYTIQLPSRTAPLSTQEAVFSILMERMVLYDIGVCRQVHSLNWCGLYGHFVGFLFTDEILILNACVNSEIVQKVMAKVHESFAGTLYLGQQFLSVFPSEQGVVSQ